jgi:hypothetical protein
MKEEILKIIDENITCNDAKDCDCIGSCNNKSSAAKEIYRLMLEREKEQLTHIVIYTGDIDTHKYCTKRLEEINSELQRLK